MLGIEANNNQQRIDTYQDRIYIRDVGNMVAYNTTEENEARNVGKQHNEIETKPKEEKKPQRKKKNQILLSEEELKQLELKKLDKF